MSDAPPTRPPTRPPPRLVHVPPFEEAQGRIVALIAAACFGVVALVFGIFVGAQAGLLLVGVFLVLFVFVGFLVRHQTTKRRRLWE